MLSAGGRGHDRHHRRRRAQPGAWGDRPAGGVPSRGGRGKSAHVQRDAGKAREQRGRGLEAVPRDRGAPLGAGLRGGHQEGAQHAEAGATTEEPPRAQFHSEQLFDPLERGQYSQGGRHGAGEQKLSRECLKVLMSIVKNLSFANSILLF